jgi:hypothetical protein
MARPSRTHRKSGSALYGWLVREHEREHGSQWGAIRSMAETLVDTQNRPLIDTSKPAIG